MKTTSATWTQTCSYCLENVFWCPRLGFLLHWRSGYTSESRFHLERETEGVRSLCWKGGLDGRPLGFHRLVAGPLSLRQTCLISRWRRRTSEDV